MEEQSGSGEIVDKIRLGEIYEVIKRSKELRSKVNCKDALCKNGPTGPTGMRGPTGPMGMRGLDGITVKRAENISRVLGKVKQGQ